MGYARTQKKFNTLDIVKGILIFAIVILHSKETFNESIKCFDVFYKYGGYIVNTFFFAASGYGISLGYRNKIEDGKVSFLSFIKSRIIKFYPMYLITELIMYIFTVIANGIHFASIKEILLNVFMVTTGWVHDIAPFNAQCWFLSVLFLVYIVYWIVERLLGKNDTVIYFIFVIAGCVLMKLHLQVPFLYYDDGIGFASFFMGCLVYKFTVKYCRGGSETIVLSMALVICVGLIFFASKYLNVFANLYHYELTFVLLIAPSIVLFCINPMIEKTIGSFGLLTDTVGQISMNVFLWHIIILRVFNAISLKAGIYDAIGLRASYVLYMAITFICCYILSVFIKARRGT